MKRTGANFVVQNPQTNVTRLKLVLCFEEHFERRARQISKGDFLKWTPLLWTFSNLVESRTRETWSGICLTILLERLVIVLLYFCQARISFRNYP